MTQFVAMEISVQKVHENRCQQKEFLLLDCREQIEHETANIDGSVLIPMNEIPARLNELEPHKERPIVVFCHKGVRSMMVTEWMRENGFPQTQSMAGGIEAWSYNIDPNVPIY